MPQKRGPEKKSAQGAGKKPAAAPSEKAAASTEPQRPSRFRGTVSGPADPKELPIDPAAAKMDATEALAASMPFNATKASEYGEAARRPTAGKHVPPDSIAVTGSTVTETRRSDKVGNGEPEAGSNAAGGSLDRVRVDSGRRALTTNQGVTIADNQNSLKAGLRGPTLLEDFILREKITHFDHERIPERVVHARGSAAHGYFECYEPLTDITRAAPFAAAGKRTPVFVRFSTVAGERGSTDTARDVRGFAVKFYTDEGNWDLVGNNIPVFFIQDAMKFPDLIHSVKPEPHHGMPQAASAHDTFWDFISLTPESAHMVMWAMSDRAIPRSLRMMQGFGVHTFRFVNEAGQSHFVKFHWSPLAGTHSLAWDEAVKISGADSDFHRRDLWEAIESGAYPEWELGVQLFTEEESDGWSFDILDPTKIVPEELVPVRPIGKMTLNRNPDNFFAETEQVAFCVAHIVPGIDFTNDPLLAGRIHSYIDTQITRLGGPNFHEIPINAPLAEVHNNQRDGMHRQAIHRGGVAHEPNSLAGGCPFQGGARGFTSFPQTILEDKVRGKAEKFAEHYAQASLFWNSQSPIEQGHIVRAFRFELTKVQTPAVRKRVVAMLANVDPDLTEGVATGLGIPVPEPLPRALEHAVKPEIEHSAALSLFARPGTGGIRTRRVAILVAAGINGAAAFAIREALFAEGAVPRFVGIHLGSIHTAEGTDLPVDATFETAPSVLFDAMVIPGGETGVENLAAVGPAVEFLKDQYRHCKPILVLGAGLTMVKRAQLPRDLLSGDRDPGLLVFDQEDDVLELMPQFIQAIAKHRHFEREIDPPMV